MKHIKFTIFCLSFFSILSIMSCSKSNPNYGPSLVSPVNQSVVPVNQVFTCNAMSNAITYQFFFTDLTSASGSVFSPQLIVNNYSPALISGHTYTWSVSVNTNNGQQGSQTWSFAVQ